MKEKKIEEEKSNNTFTYISIVAVVAIIAVFVMFAGSGSKQTQQPIILDQSLIGDARSSTGLTNFQQFNCNPGQMVGDLNNDGVVNTLDIVKMNKIISGEINIPRNLCCVDLTGDGRVTSEDVKVLADLFISGNPRPIYCKNIVDENSYVHSSQGYNNYLEIQSSGNQFQVQNPHNPHQFLELEKPDYHLEINNPDYYLEIQNPNYYLEIQHPNYNFDCKAGQMVGDLNRDGKIDVLDIIKMNKIISGEINMPRNICCVDITGDGKVTSEDVKVLTDLFMSGNPRPRYCYEFNCKPGQMVGDLNNDGKINMLDIQKLINIISGEINMPRNICCADVNNDGKVSSDDVKSLIDLFMSGNPRPRYCSQHTLYR